MKTFLYLLILILSFSLFSCNDPTPTPTPNCTCPSGNVLQPTFYLIGIVLPGGDSLTGGDLLFDYKIQWNRDTHSWAPEPTVLYRVVLVNGRIYYSPGPIETNHDNGTVSFFDLESGTVRKFIEGQVSISFVNCTLLPLAPEEEIKKDYGLQLQEQYASCPVHGSKTN